MAFTRKSVEPFYSSAKEWVDNLPYDRPLEKFDGYVYRNPFKVINEGLRPGVHPAVVYERLFCEDKYMIVSKEELRMLRTTIQYQNLALNDMHKKLCGFVKKQGFKQISRQVEPWRWDAGVKFIMSSFLRGDIRIQLWSWATPQEFIPNSIPIWSMDRMYVNPETGRRKTLAHLASFDHILIEDELGEKSVEAFEQYIKEHGG